MNKKEEINISDLSNAVGWIFNRPEVDMVSVLEAEGAPRNPSGSNLVFVKINSISFRDRRDIRKALAQFYGVLHAMNRRVYYIMKCEGSVVSLYMGVDNSGMVATLDSDELTHSLLGILPGCQVEPLNSGDNGRLIQGLTNSMESCLITGVPTCQLNWEKREQHQEEEKARTGVERILDSLAGEDFVLSILCEPMPRDELQEYRSRVGELHDLIKPWAKYNVSDNSSRGELGSQSDQTGDADAKVKNEADNSGTTLNGPTKTLQVKDGHIGMRVYNWFKSFIAGGTTTAGSHTEQLSPTQIESHTVSYGFSHTETRSTTKTVGWNNSHSMGVNRELVCMELGAVVSQLEKLHKRLMQAGGEGMWKTCIMFHADKETILRRASFAGTAIWSGDDSAIDPIRCLSLQKPVGGLMRSQNELLDMQFTHEGEDQKQYPIHPFGGAYSNLYTCLTHKELAHIADFPHWELPGITVLPLVEYGRMSPVPRLGISTVELGGLIDRTVNRAGYTYSMPQKVMLGYDQLNKHCFVSGVTGSGKSTTMRCLLRQIANHPEQPVPFMVIEPVKTEYRALAQEGVALRVFSPGRRYGLREQFSMNPFSFPEEIGLFSHLDFLKSVFCALLGAYSSMPYLLEEMLCKAYEDCGWDLSTGENQQLKREMSALQNLNPAAAWQVREQYMPLISSLPSMVDDVLESNFAGDKSDYRVSLRGALKARLKSLCNSVKGEFLARHDTHDFAALLKENVLVELEAFSDNDEKAFIMAMLLGRIYEYRQAENLRGEIPKDKLRHVVVLEESHRLLSRTEGKVEHQANPRAKAAETFCDMLAEVRSYGQGMIIVDQIPSKLTPDVMKNTEVKIVHRLLAKDDREAVGATMNLQKEQIEDLARHAPGEATMYFGNLVNALHVKITE